MRAGSDASRRTADDAILRQLPEEAGIEAAQFALMMALDSAKDKGQAALAEAWEWIRRRSRAT